MKKKEQDSSKKKMPASFEERALVYHSKGRPGKIEVIPSKRTKTQRDLSLAYSPGVAVPCQEIEKNPSDVYKYTAKGNLVAVISNGTAVLGLGDIGPEASKPVMEGKGVLFKVFADIDVFDIEINEKDPDKFVDIVKAISPTFGGINLEDIKAPECFTIEKRLKQESVIPIMHDDQHGTAIISGAALLNALELQKKKISKATFVVSGAGAAATSCCLMYKALGADPKKFKIFDRKGILHKDREPSPAALKDFFVDKSLSNLTLEQAIKGADVFIGLSVGGIVTKNMVKSMAKHPIVFAMANPTPEISWEEACSVRNDLIMATGRSDFPNQVNNVLGFPYIFRGALDVRAKAINEAMKMAAVKALAELAKKPVPDIVSMAYDDKRIAFGKEYIIPKPLDPRLLSTVSPAVAKAAMESGVAQHLIKDWEAYEKELNERLGYYNQFINIIGRKARNYPKRIVFGEGEEINIIKAARTILDEGIGFPILLGDREAVAKIAFEHRVNMEDIPVCNPTEHELTDIRTKFAEQFYKLRQRKGVTKFEAEMLMKRRTYFGCMMIKNQEADTFISGFQTTYSKTIKPAIETIGLAKNAQLVAAAHVISTGKRTLYLADTTININPTAEQIAEITMMVAQGIQLYGIEPKIALLSYSNFGSSKTDEAIKMKKACDMVRKKMPSLKIDGEMHADIALNNERLKENYPFSTLIDEEVNCLIFPNLASSNIAYNLLSELSNFEYIGPIILGLNDPVHALQVGTSVRNIINMAIVGVVEAQRKNKEKFDLDKLKKTFFWKQFGGMEKLSPSSE